jgi:small subunit ribosomal protein S5e
VVVLARVLLGLCGVLCPALVNRLNVRVWRCDAACCASVCAAVDARACAAAAPSFRPPLRFASRETVLVGLCATWHGRRGHHSPPRSSLPRFRAAVCNMASTDIKLFGKWSFDDVEVADITLEDYIAVKPRHAVYLPHTAGRYQMKRFKKAQCPIVERLVNTLMYHGRNTGKKILAVNIVKSTFEIINLTTDRNPLQVFVEAIINSGPREDSTRVGSAGVVRRQAVDVSPFRRVSQALYLISVGARQSSFRNIKTIAECLADEIINASKGSSNSYAIKKKDEIERVAKANR